MKKIVAMIVMILICLSSFGCFKVNNQCPQQSNVQSLYSNSTTVIQDMLKQIEEPNQNVYKELFGEHWIEKLQEHTKNIIPKNYSKSNKILQVELLDKAVTNIFGNELSSETMFLCKEIMNDTLVSTVRNTISNDNDIALSSVFAKENSFMNESFSGQKVWFLYFDNTYAIVVTFNEGEDDTIIMRAEFIFSMNFYNLTLDDIMKIYVNSFGEYSVKIDEIVV